VYDKILEDVPKGHFAAVSEKNAFDYRHIANDKSREKEAFLDITKILVEKSFHLFLQRA
jgi:hypothetical protein